MLAEVWYVLLAGMLAIYVILDGFDLGAGMLHLFVAKTNAERNVVLRSIGPVWDGNEVWLLAAVFGISQPLTCMKMRYLPRLSLLKFKFRVGREKARLIYKVWTLFFSAVSS